MFFVKEATIAVLLVFLCQTLTISDKKMKARVCLLKSAVDNQIMITI